MSFSQTNPYATPGSHRVSPRPVHGSARLGFSEEGQHPRVRSSGCGRGSERCCDMDACSRPLVPSRIGGCPSTGHTTPRARPSITLAIDRRARCRASPPPSPFPRASARVSPRLRARSVRPPRIRPRRGVQHREPALRAPLRLRRRHRRNWLRAANADLAPRARLFDLPFLRPTRAEDPPRVARASTARTGLIHTRRE